MNFILFAHLELRTLEVPALVVALALLWLMIIGGSFGSFLNVVVYRVPQGLSLLFPGSHCPRCGTPILPRDNVPMLGWVFLRGKCRACRGPISPRYPLVELACALMFTALAAVEPIFGGWNLPIPVGPAGDAYPLWGILAFHFALVLTLLAAALIAVDREYAPLRFWLVPLSAGFVAAAVWPMLRPIATPGLAEAVGPFRGAVEGFIGLVVGAALGVASWPAASAGGRARSGHLSAIGASACVGVFLGWQAATAIGTAAMFVWSVLQLLRDLIGLRRDPPWLMIHCLATFAWLLGWRLIAYHWPIVGLAAPWYLPPTAFAATLMLGIAGRALHEAARKKHEIRSSKS